MASREDIYGTLFEKLVALKTVGDIVTASRILVHWDKVPHEQQPAVYQAQINEVFTPVGGQPAKRTLYVNWVVYVARGNDPTKVPAEELNNLLDKLEEILKPDVGEDNQSLGGLVNHAWISGNIETDEGTLGEQAVAIVPIAIDVPQGFSCP